MVNIYRYLLIWLKSASELRQKLNISAKSVCKQCMHIGILCGLILQGKYLESRLKLTSPIFTHTCGAW